MPHHISFQGDRTCNLSCPSCRTGIIKTPDEKKEQQAQIGKIISANLFSQASDQRIVLETSGTGELFASELLISFVNGIEKTKFPNFKLHIGTNGLLCPERWHKILDLDNFVEKITVSIDAAYGPTYEQIRRGGHWNDILDAMKFLQNKKHSLGIELHTRMIVQQQNYKEIKDFYNLCQTFDVDVVEYSRLTNWGTWLPSEFQRHDVFNPVHPEFNQAKLAIDSVKSLPGTWFAGL
jgi:MoaA/NifB/PqqE/SkfB family radical SAM enzyme